MCLMCLMSDVSAVSDLSFDVSDTSADVFDQKLIIGECPLWCPHTHTPHNAADFLSRQKPKSILPFRHENFRLASNR